MARGYDHRQADRRSWIEVVRVPGLANIWVPPIRNRIDMLATGIKSPVGVKVAGTDLQRDRSHRRRNRTRREALCQA